MLELKEQTTRAAEFSAQTRTRVQQLCRIALDGLAPMFDRDRGMFVFRVRRVPGGSPRPEGCSHRYTAITLLGLAEESPETARDVLGGRSPQDVARALLAALERNDNLGDVALTLWAARRHDVDGRETALRRLREMDPISRPHPTVELAWALSAVVTEDVLPDAAAMRAPLAERLIAACPASGIFPHHIPAAASPRLRRHVGCFADQVYPILALAQAARAGCHPAALRVAQRTAARICAELGPAGQWWWHYDTRTGRVIEGYPVYSVHQDSMAPMALLALAEAGGELHAEPIERGLDWLYASPELGGGSLIDEPQRVIWRKVARREPRKFVRRMQAACSAVHRSLRVPAVDWVFSASSVDDECRPYHLGWILYAWSRSRTTRATGRPS